MAYFDALFAASANVAECAAAAYSHRLANVIRLRRPTAASIALALALNIGRVTSRIARTMRPISVSSSAPNGTATISASLASMRRCDGCRSTANLRTTNASFTVALRKPTIISN